MTREELESAVREYGDAVFRTAFSVLRKREDAEDVMQETFLKLYSSEKRFESQEHMRFWLMRVAVNEARRAFRWYRRVSPLEELGDAPFETPEETGLFEAVMALPEKYRLALYLHYYEDMPVRDIARVTSAGESTVQTRLARGRAMLEKKLKEDA